MVMIRILPNLLFILLLGGMAASTSAAPSRGPVVLAAASLQESLTAAADDWTRRGHARPVLSFAASSALARQIEAGAPADLFFSADMPWMTEVEKKGYLVRGTRTDFLTNRLVLITPRTQAIRLTITPGFPLAHALGPSRLAMADPDSVPAGKYGKAALTTLNVWKSVEGKIARGENVRAALALVERGEARLGIVYATDARASTAVRVVATFPASSHPPIIYPIARLSTSRHPEAEAFRHYLLSARGKGIFARFGFAAR